MPESKPPRRRRFVTPPRAQSTDVAAPKPVNPRWWAPVMVALMVIGLVWIVTAYITRLEYPIGAIGAWNIAVGFGVALIGFAMTTRWR